MHREEFQDLSRDYVRHDSYLKFLDVLDLSYFASFRDDDDRLQEAFASRDRLPTIIRWLEICFFLDLDKGGDLEFFGILPMTLDTSGEGEIEQEELIAIGRLLGEPQPLNWEEIMKCCETYNDELEVQSALPFVRVSIDESRSRSLYYPLTHFDYDEMRMKCGFELVGGAPEGIQH